MAHCKSCKVCPICEVCLQSVTDQPCPIEKDNGSTIINTNTVKGDK